MKKNKSDKIVTFAIISAFSFTLLPAAFAVEDKMNDKLINKESADSIEENLIKTHKEGCSPYHNGLTPENDKTQELVLPQGDSDRIKGNF